MDWVCCHGLGGVLSTHRMVRVGRFKDYLVPSPCQEQGCPSLDYVAQDPSSLLLNTSRAGASSTSLGNLCQGPTSLWVLLEQSTPWSPQQCFGNVLWEKLCSSSRGALPPTCPGWHGGDAGLCLLPGHMQLCLWTHIHTQFLGIQTTWKSKSTTQVNLNSAVCLNFIWTAFFLQIFNYNILKYFL